MKMNLCIEWSSGDMDAWSAVFLRNGKPWFLNGALVGLGDDPPNAVADLIGIACHLVEHGENFLIDDPLPLADRRWLFSMLDGGNIGDNLAMYAALRTAELAAS